MFFLSFAHQLNKIYLASSKLKIAETNISPYYFVFVNSIFVDFFFWNNYYNPQGLNQLILPPGLTKASLKKQSFIHFLSIRLNLQLTYHASFKIWRNLCSQCR